MDRRRGDDRAVPGDATDQPHYTRVTIEVAADYDDELRTLPSLVHALVLARGMRPDVMSAVTLSVDADRRTVPGMGKTGDPGAIDGARGALPGPIRPLISYVKDLHDAHPRAVIMVFIPEYVVTPWWQQLQHNLSAQRFKTRLLFTPGVVVVSVP